MPASTRGCNVQNNHSKFVRIVETTNQVLQIVALLVARIWALWTWNQASAPSLKTGLSLSGSNGQTIWQEISTDQFSGWVNAEHLAVDSGN